MCNYALLCWVCIMLQFSALTYDINVVSGSYVMLLERYAWECNLRATHLTVYVQPESYTLWSYT